MADPASGEYVTLANCTLLMLNRWIDCSTGYFYHPASVYEQNVSDWNGTRIVLNPDEFCALHPDALLYEADPDTALTDVKAHDVGYIDDVRIIWEGHPRLVAAMHISETDAYGKMALDLYYAGQFGISIADIFEANEGVVTGNIRPNHVLVFKEDGWNMPADKGAVAANSRQRVPFFSNQSRPGTRPVTPVAANSASDLKPLFASLVDAIKGIMNPSGVSEVQSIAANKQEEDKPKMTDTPTPEPHVAALNQQIGALEQDKAALTVELATARAELQTAKSELEATATERDGLKTQIAEHEAAEKDAQFNEFVSTIVPPGEVATPEATAEMRDVFFNRPHELASKMVQWAEHKATLPGKTGTKQVAMNTGGPEKPVRKYANLFKKV